MKLLIITQVIDTEHPILGFFHRWVQEFAKHCEHVHVICLEVGKHSLPANVTVHSLGKEDHQTGGPSFVRGKTASKGGPRVLSNLATKIRYTYRFYKLIWSLRKDYDQVFVHMNQIYVILGVPIWKLLNKKVALWYAHGTVSPSLRLATIFADKIFTSTKEGFRIKTHKLNIIGQGIDTDLFKSKEKGYSEKLRLITVGRISQSKNIETLLMGCAILKEKEIKFNFKIIGPTLTEADVVYRDYLFDLVTDLDMEDNIEWIGPVSQGELPQYLQNSDIFIHDGSTNSLDKVLLEAILCNCLVISSNPSYKDKVFLLTPDAIFEPKNSKRLAFIISKMALSEDRNKTEAMASLYSLVYANDSISKLVKKIVKSIS